MGTPSEKKYSVAPRGAILPWKNDTIGCAARNSVMAPRCTLIREQEGHRELQQHLFTVRFRPYDVVVDIEGQFHRL